MSPDDIRSPFLAYLKGRDIDLASAPPTIGFDAMLQFFAHERVDGCEPVEGADQLLYQWGTHDWGNGPHFELDLARQIVLPGDVDDDAIWQLHLTYEYSAAPGEGIVAGNKWCATPADLDVFVAFVSRSPALHAVTSVEHENVRVYFECAG